MPPRLLRPLRRLIPALILLMIMMGIVIGGGGVQAAADPVILVAVGDIMLDRSLALSAATRNDDYYAFRPTADWTQTADIAVGNLETTILPERGFSPESKRYTFRAPPYAAESLRWAGYDVLSFANNHAADYGLPGLLGTLEALRGVGIGSVGAGPNLAAARAPLIVERKGIRIAFLGFVNVPPDSGIPYDNAKNAAGPNTPGVAWAGSTAGISEAVQVAKNQADVVIVLLHAGTEYSRVPDAVQLSLSRAAIRAGAAAVIGAHPHILQGAEWYEGSGNRGYIAYSLGNFIFDMPEVVRTAALCLSITAEGVQAAEWLPAVIESGGRPRPATGRTAESILADLAVLSRAIPPESR